MLKMTNYAGFVNQATRRMLFFSILCLFSMVMAFLCHASPELQAYAIPATKNFDTIENQVRPLLTSEGSMVRDTKENRLLIVDEPQVQKKISLILSPWSPAPKNIRIQISSTSLGSEQVSEFDISGRAKTGGVVVGSGHAGNEKMNVRTRSLLRENDVLASQFLVVGSGHKAYIKIAEEIPEVSWIRQWLPSNDVFAGSMNWRDIGTQMLVEPTVLPNGLIRVQLTPSFSYFLQGQRSTVEVQRLATEVTLAEGAEFDLGGMNMGDQEFRRRFFQTTSAYGSSRSVHLKLRATIEDLGPKPKYAE